MANSDSYYLKTFEDCKPEWESRFSVWSNRTIKTLLRVVKMHHHYDKYTNRIVVPHKAYLQALNVLKKDMPGMDIRRLSARFRALKRKYLIFERAKDKTGLTAPPYYKILHSFLKYEAKPNDYDYEKADIDDDYVESEEEIIIEPKVYSGSMQGREMPDDCRGIFYDGLVNDDEDVSFNSEGYVNLMNFDKTEIEEDSSDDSEENMNSMYVTNKRPRNSYQNNHYGKFISPKNCLHKSIEDGGISPSYNNNIRSIQVHQLRESRRHNRAMENLFLRLTEAHEKLAAAIKERKEIIGS